MSQHLEAPPQSTSAGSLKMSAGTHLLQQADSLTVCTPHAPGISTYAHATCEPTNELLTHVQHTQPGDMSHTRETACEQLPPSLTAC